MPRDVEGREEKSLGREKGRELQVERDEIEQKYYEISVQFDGCPYSTLNNPAGDMDPLTPSYRRTSWLTAPSRGALCSYIP